MRLCKIEGPEYTIFSKPMKSFVVFCSALIIIISFYGCSNKPSPQPVKAAKTKAAEKAAPEPAVAQPEIAAEEPPKQEGYVYQRRDRRDPFVPLIVPKKKAKKGERVKVGTLEGYDISEFTLAAIAKKGKQFIALVTTPDNRSFTVNRDTVIGLNKGKVKDISENKMIIVEYSEDFRGELKSREIILEFHKGEVE